MAHMQMFGRQPRRHFAKKATKDERPDLDETEEEETNQNSKGEEDERPELEEEDYEESRAMPAFIKYAILFVALWFGYDYMWPWIGSQCTGQTIGFMEHLITVAAEDGDVQSVLESPSAFLFNWISVVFFAFGKPAAVSFVEQEGTYRCLALCRLVEKKQVPMDVLKQIGSIFSTCAGTKEGREAFGANQAVMDYTLKMCRSARPDFCQPALMAARAMLMDETLKKQFIALRGVPMLIDAFTSAKAPQLQEMAFAIIAGFLYELPEVHELGLSRKGEVESFFNVMAQVGSAMSEQGQNLLAVNAFKAMLQLNPTSPEILTVTAGLQMQLGQFDDAADNLSHALEVSPGTPQACYNLAKINLSKCSKEDFKTLNECVDLLESALPGIRRGAPRANVHPGMKVQPDSRLATHPLTSPIFSLLVMSLEKLGRTDEARRYAEEWSLWCLNEDAPQTALGQLLLKSKQYSGALEMFEKANKISPEKPSIRYLSAICYLESGQYQNGIDEVNQAIGLGEIADAQFQMKQKQAEWKQEQMDKEGAKHGTPAIRVSMPAEPLVNILEDAHLLKGRLLTKLEQWNNAANSFDSSAALQKTDSVDGTARVMSAFCFARMGQYEEAASRLSDAQMLWQDACDRQDLNYREFFENNVAQEELRRSIRTMLERHPQPAFDGARTKADAMAGYSS